MPRHDLSSTEVSRLVGMPYQSLDFWLRSGIVACDVPADGIGSRRRYTVADLTAVLIAHHLKQIGLPMAAARNLNALIREHWVDLDPEHAGWVLATTLLDPAAGTWFADEEQAEAAVSALVDGAQWSGLCWVINVRGFARRAEELLEGELKRKQRGGAGPS